MICTCMPSQNNTDNEKGRALAVSYPYVLESLPSRVIPRLMGCFATKGGVFSAYDLIQEERVDVIIGPVCSTGKVEP